MRHLLLSLSVASLVLIGAGIGYGLRPHTVERITEHHTVERIEQPPRVEPHAPVHKHKRVRKAPVGHHRQPGDDSADELNHHQVDRISSHRAYGPTTYHGEQLCKDDYGRLVYFPPRGALCARPTWAI